MENFRIKVPNFYPNRSVVNINLKFNSRIFQKTVHFLRPRWLQSLVVVSGSNIPVSPPLNEVQLMLLRLFSRPMTEEEVKGVRSLLLNYYEQQLQKEVEEVIQEKGIQRKQFDELLQNDQRTK